MLVSLILTQSAHCFVTQRALSKPTYRDTVRPFRSTREQEGTEKDRLDEAYDGYSRPNKRRISPHATPHAREYWLDLRDTAILPNEALKFLEQNLFLRQEDIVSSKDLDTAQLKALSLVDRVLLSEGMFQKSLSHECYVDIMYTPDGDSLLVANDDRLKQSFPIGKVVACVHNENMDPLAALETTGDGGWLLVDSKSYDTETIDWLARQVSGLVAFLLSATSASDASHTSGLLIPTTISTGSLPSGGVAIACKNKAAFLETNVALEQSLGARMITTSTESGIVLPTGMPDSRPGEDAPLRTALVLPFDVMLWETVLDLRDLEELEQ